MDFERLNRYLLSKKETTYDYPFNETTRVYRIGGKIFVLLDEIKTPIALNLKCDPIYSLELRSLYSYINAGHHMNKKHWNTFMLVDHADENLLKELIDHSYELVFASLSKKLRDEIKLK
jgi:predicted DNA-binding protein (MmcQ/YjbR family)